MPRWTRGTRRSSPRWKSASAPSCGPDSPGFTVGCGGASAMASDESSSRSLAGAVLSRRWRLLRRLGAGGMGEVYAADPVEGGTRVAVKILRPEYLAEPSVLARFLEEASTCMRLVHPNIVRMLECASAEDGSPYLVMELLEGVPLGAYTANGGRGAG